MGPRRAPLPRIPSRRPLTRQWLHTLQERANRPLTRSQRQANPELAEQLYEAVENPEQLLHPRRRERRERRPRGPPPPPAIELFPFHVEQGVQALAGHATSLTVVSDVNDQDPRRFLPQPFWEASRETMEQAIRQTMRTVGTGTVGFNVTINLLFARPGSEDYQLHYRATRRIASTEAQITQGMNQSFAAILGFFHADAGFQRGEVFHTTSNGVLIRILSFNVTMTAVQMQGSIAGGSSYLALPEWIAKKQACINIRNQDDYCLYWCIELAFDLQQNPSLKNGHRWSRYIHPQRVHHLDYTGMDLRQTVTDVCSSMEKRAAKQGKPIRLQVFTSDVKDEQLLPPKPFTIVYATQHDPSDRDALTIPLFLIPSTFHEPKGHFVFIKDLNRLLNRSGEHRHFCTNCLQSFSTSALLIHHQQDFRCFQQAPCSLELPHESNAITCFNKIKACHRQPLVIYADFECIITELSEGEQNAHYEKRHEPCGFGMLPVSTCPGFLHQSSYLYRPASHEPLYVDGVNRVVRAAVQHIKFLVNQFCAFYEAQGVQEDPFLDSVEMIYNSMDHHCAYCNDFMSYGLHYLVRRNDQSVWVHERCRKQYEFTESDRSLKRSFKIPIYFHNLSGYDGHLLLQGLSAELTAGKIECICQSGEDLLTFHFGHVQFMDTFAMLKTSLGKLVDQLISRPAHQADDWFPPDIETRFPLYHAAFPHLCQRLGVEPTRARFELLLGKGVYPYEYMDSMDRMDETILPPQVRFYSQLKGEHISDSDYQRAVRVWNDMHIQTMGQYHDLYLMLDVLLLADVYEQFRNQSLQQFDLDPAHYLSLPGLSRDSAFRLRPEEDHPSGRPSRPPFIHLFHDAQVDMYLFAERAIRGGICMVPGRFGKASDTHSIEYVDANSLYPWAMTQSLPTGDYEWCDMQKLPFRPDSDSFRYSSWFELIADIEEDDSRGYLFEIDYEFPGDTHDFLKDYPPGPSSKVLNWEDLSPFSQSYHRDQQLPLDGSEKLICSLLPGQHYIVHGRNLQLYLRLGMRVTRFHRVLGFRQSKWLKSFIDHCARMRSQATTEFEQEFWKLMMNTVFGKTLQNDRKFKHACIVTTPKELIKKTKRPDYSHARIITEDIVFVHQFKTKVKLDKPIMVGLTILELSKVRMFSFYYEFLKPCFGHRLRLLMTDTDSLIMLFQSKYYLVELMNYYGKEAVEAQFDLSNFPPDHPFFNKTNKKVVGKFKHELLDIAEFVGLRAKMYSLLKQGEEDQVHHLTKNKIRKAKGVTVSVLKKYITHEHYRSALLHQPLPANVERMEMHSLRAKSGKIYSYHQWKHTLSPADTKLFQVDRIQTYPYGHKDALALKQQTPNLNRLHESCARACTVELSSCHQEEGLVT